MTIVAAVACPEGIALAADTRLTGVDAKGHSLVASDYSRKLFELGIEPSGLTRFAAATSGWGILEGKTIAGHMADFEFSLQFDETVTIADMAALLRAHFEPIVQSHAVTMGVTDTANALTITLAGSEPDSTGQLMQLNITGSDTQLGGTAKPTWAWAGDGGLILHRLVKGIDASFVAGLSKTAKGKAVKLEYNVPTGVFAMQDAVDFAGYFVRTAIDTMRFANGTFESPGTFATCGGQVEILSVEPPFGVRWLKRMQLEA